MSADHLSDAILIVDDEQANVRLLSHVLARAGYVAATSTLNSAEVVALHDENHYALIVLDLQMPVMTGYDVMKELMKLDEDQRPAILVMSADPTQSGLSIEAGATDFLGKPYSLTDVLARIEAILSARRDASPAPQEDLIALRDDSASPETPEPETASEAQPSGFSANVPLL